MEATFCFVDLAGFSALTEAHGDDAAADLALRFAGLVTETLAGDGRLVKTIGDAVLVVSPSPSPGIRFSAEAAAHLVNPPHRLAVGREQQDGAVVDDDLHVALVMLDA